MHALRSLRMHALVALFVLAPRAALACPVCTGGQKEEVGRAMLFGSIVLSILPLLVVCAVAWWVRRRARTIAARDVAAAASHAHAHP
jgi:hypothetical protein